MKLYLLEQVYAPDWDETEAVVVLAPSPVSARALASTQAGAEGSDTWLSPQHSTCKVINPGAVTRPQVVLRSFKAG